MERFLTYEQFGAKGDGLTDDFDAIIATHEEANRTGTPVKAKDGAKYLIKKIGTATIKTDVDFGTAEIIIDDREVPHAERGVHIFNVVSDFEPFTFELKSFSKHQKKLDFPHEGKVYVNVFNENHKIFIREGLNKNAGHPTHDCMIVDEDGSILTPIDWDYYDEITKVYARRVDDKPITVKGGFFTTIANQAESFYHYHARGFSCVRSNITFENIDHNVTGELDHGAPYAGFIFVNNSYNVTLRNCFLCPHFIYWTESAVPGQKVAMGSYDINIASCIDSRIEGIRQHVDIHDRRYWGLIHTHYCKNLTVENCIMSRYDAHEGVTNITLRNCEFGHQCVNLIGHGEALIENCSMTGGALFALRGDFGCIWDGNITIKNCTWNVRFARDYHPVFWARNCGRHDFGFDCRMPKVLTIDGLTLTVEDGVQKIFTVFPDYTDNLGEEKPFPYLTPDKLVLGRISVPEGCSIEIAQFPEQYKNTVIERI